MTNKYDWTEKWVERETKEIELKYQNRSLKAKIWFSLEKRLVAGMEVKYYENDKLVVGVFTDGFCVTIGTLAGEYEKCPLQSGKVYPLRPDGYTPLLGRFSRKIDWRINDVLFPDKAGITAHIDLIVPILQHLENRLRSVKDKRNIEQLVDAVQKLALDVFISELPVVGDAESHANG